MFYFKPPFTRPFEVNSNYLLWFVTLIFAVLIPFVWFIPLALWGVILGIALILSIIFCSSAFLCASAISVFIFTGLLFSVQVGFTFKAAQLFSLLGVIAIIFASLLGYRRGTYFHWMIWLPFLFFFLAVLPSFWNADIYRLLEAEKHTSIRLVFNYLFLQMIAFVVYYAADSKEKVEKLLKFGLFSVSITLVFGYFQQIGFYFGFYNPHLYAGIHSTFVDVYGAFLRFSPGTFANEYGKILQTCGLLLVGLLFLDRSILKGFRRKVYTFLLIVIVFTLIINLTRASWLVFAAGTLFILFIARVKLRTIISIAIVFGIILYILSFLSQLISEVNALSAVGERFSELSDVRSFSAGQRLTYWSIAWEAFLKHPFIGNGWGGYIATHNVPLQLLAETGFLGLLTYYGLMGWISWLMYQGWKVAEDKFLKEVQFSILIAFIGCHIFDMTNHGIFHFVLWYLIALGLATAELNLSSSFKRSLNDG